MPATVILGGQWGDEGKAKVVDFLMPHHDAVIRYQGGANAGHTVVTKEGKYAFHQIPSGVLYPDMAGLLGNGMVVDPFAFLDELENLSSRGVDARGRLFISSGAHVVAPYHKMLDGLYESGLKECSIGSTRKGIGPAYSDKYRRCGLRMGDFILPEGELRGLVKDRVRSAGALVEAFGGEPLNAEAIADGFTGIRDAIAPMVVDGQQLVFKWKDEGKRILLEGAQGTLLDIDHGTYPFVTSSSCSVGGALTGAGLAPRDVGRVIGIFKAYTTRVGNGPFPTELFDGDGKHLAEKGNEFGTTTGRPRRCGWLDMVAAKYSVRLNGLTEIALTKLDVLTGLPSLKFCTAYELDGERTEAFPHDAGALARVRPVLEELPGWDRMESGKGDYSSLHDNAKRYVEEIERRLGVKASFISYGPEREKTIIREGF